MPNDQIVSLAVFAVTLALLAIFAAAETALERSNRARIQALAARGDIRALRIADSAERIAQTIDPLTFGRIVNAALVVLALAYFGAERWGSLEGIVGLGAVGVLVTVVVQMTVGLVVARQPEVSALQISQFIRLSNVILGVPSWIVALPARLVARTISAVTPEPDDILSLVEREEASGGVEEEERRMIRGVIGLEDKMAREIMVPRIDIAAADIEDGIEDVATIVIERGFSRVPIYRETIDDIVGIVYAKDMLRAASNSNGRENRERKVTELIRDPVFIPESKRLDQLLTEMRASRTHMAIVLDEYGGTAGLVTIEDLLEEIVGEIEDEYDTARAPVEMISEHEVVIDAGADTEALQELFGVNVESEDYETVGGLVIHELGRLPSVGDEICVEGLKLRVLSMAGRRIRRLRIEREVEDAVESIAAK